MFSKFLMFSWCMKIFYVALDLMPPVVRACVFKLWLGHCGRNVMIDYGVYIRYPWLVEVGDQVAINRNCSFYPSYLKKKKIIIKNNVTIAYNVSFIGGSQDYRHQELPDTGGDIVVRDHVWIGCNVTILPGITIGEGAVIGAGSVVTRDVAPYTIVAGNPARVIKERVLQEKP